jgi:hypothetical protein
MKLTASHLRKIISEEIEIAKFRKVFQRELHEMYEAGELTDADLLNEINWKKIGRTAALAGGLTAAALGGGKIAAQDAEIRNVQAAEMSAVGPGGYVETDLRKAIEDAKKRNPDAAKKLEAQHAKAIKAIEVTGRAYSSAGKRAEGEVSRPAVADRGRQSAMGTKHKDADIASSAKHAYGEEKLNDLIQQFKNIK